MRITEVDNEVTQAQLDSLEKVLDRVFAQLNIDVEFTRHFLDRVNDERNVRQITITELAMLFKKEFQKWGKPIARLGPDAEAVMKDLATDINIPFALNWNSASGMLELVAKTVMRKKNFRTPNQEFPVETYALTPKQQKRISESFIAEAVPAFNLGGLDAAEFQQRFRMSPQQASNTFRNVVNLSPGFQSPRMQNALNQYFHSNPQALQAANDNFGPRQQGNIRSKVVTGIRGLLGRALGVVGAVLTPTTANQGEQAMLDQMQAIDDFQRYLLNNDPQAYMDFVQAEWNSLPAETQAEYEGGPWDPKTSADYNAAEEAVRMLKRGEQMATIDPQPIPVAPNINIPDAPIAPVPPADDASAPRVTIDPETPVEIPPAPTAPELPSTDTPPEVDPSAPAQPRVQPRVDPSSPEQPATPTAPDVSPRVQPKTDPRVDPEQPVRPQQPGREDDPEVDPQTPELPSLPQPRVTPTPAQPKAPEISPDRIPGVPGTLTSPGVVSQPGTLAPPALGTPPSGTGTRPPRNNRDNKKRRKPDFGLGGDSDYDNPLRKWVHKHTPLSFESSVMEGGSMPGVGAIHIDEIMPTLAKLEKSLGLNLRDFTLGSVGKREFSGDIDVAINLKPEQLPDFAAKLENDPNIEGVTKSSVFMTKVKIENFDEEKSDGRPRTGYVQIDFMPGDPGWMKTYYHSPSEKESKYKGVFRNIMISTIAAVYKRKDSDQKLSDGRSLESERYMWSPSEGLIRVRRTPVMNKKGTAYTKKNNNEKIDGPWRTADEIAKELGLGDAGVLNSFETLLAAVEKNYSAEQVAQIKKGFADNNVVQDIGVPQELTDK